MSGERYGILNLTTGELKELNEGDSVHIRSAKQNDLLSNTTQLNKKEDFVKIYLKPLLKLSTLLSNAEAWYVTYLIQYLDYTSGALKDQSGRLMTMDDFMDETNLKSSVTYNIIKKLTDKGVIAKCETEGHKYFVMNPYIFMRGKRVNNTLVDLFKNTQWKRMFDNYETEQIETSEEE